MATPGEIVQRLREEKGMTLAELAAKVGLSPTAVRNRESGLTRLHPSEIAEFAEALGEKAESLRSMIQASLLPLRAATHPGIPIINKASAGPAWDFEEYGVSSREGAAYMAREEGETSDDLFAVEVTGDSMEPDLYAGDRLVLWPVPQGMPEGVIEGKIVYARFREETGGGGYLAKLKLLGGHDDERGHRARLVKVNPKHKSRDIWLTDLERLAIGVRISRRLWQL